MMVSAIQAEQFASDNYSGICPEALEYLLKANAGSAIAYGNDDWTQLACDHFRELFETDCEVYFVANGTAANALSLAALCQLRDRSAVSTQSTHGWCPLCQCRCRFEQNTCGTHLEKWCGCFVF